MTANDESVKVQAFKDSWNKAQKRNLKETLKENAVFLILLVMTVAIFGNFFIATVDGESMTNTYQDGDKVICSRLFSPKCGDVILCDVDAELEQGTVRKRLIKRIIAMEGDTIDIKDGKVYLNGEVLDEPYIREPMEYVPENSQEYPLTIPEGKLFVMGDNRNASHDSRDSRYGLIDRSNVIGKVVCDISAVKASGTMLALR